MHHLYLNLTNVSYYDIKGNEEYELVVNNVTSFLREYVTALVCGTSVKELNAEYGIVENSLLYNATEYAASVIVNIENNNEWDAVLGALEGNYLLAGLFADPSYGDSIPSGYDGYASDSTSR